MSNYINLLAKKKKNSYFKKQSPILKNIKRKQFKIIVRFWKDWCSDVVSKSKSQKRERRVGGGWGGSCPCGNMKKDKGESKKNWTSAIVLEFVGDAQFLVCSTSNAVLFAPVHTHTHRQNKKKSTLQLKK